MRILFVLLFLALGSCKGDPGNPGKNKPPQSPSEKITFEGKFVKIEKINQKEYYLYLENDPGDTIRFLTLMPISQNEIELLKVDGHNIVLVYYHFYNSVRKLDERVVTAMTPVYKFYD